MSTGQKTVSVFLTLIGGLLITILGLYTHWPLWAWPTAAVALFALH
jgi:membrane protein YdbS with pleckstrin-like domain